MKKIWLIAIFAASMLPGCVVAAGPPYYDDYGGYYDNGGHHGHGHWDGHRHGHEDDDD